MASVEEVLEHVERQCKQRGVRLTAKRKQVLSGLIQAETAMSAYELADYCQETFGQALPAMTVYRILDFLEAEQFVHKLNVASKYIACSHIACDHEHEVPQFLICSRCLKVREVSIPKATVDTLQSNAKQAGFVLATPQFEMNCLCEACSREQGDTDAD